MVAIDLVVLFMVLLELDTSNCITLDFLNMFDEAGAARSISGELPACEGQTDHRNVLPVAAENTLAKAINGFLIVLTWSMKPKQRRGVAV